MGTDGTAAAEGPAPDGNARVLAGRYRLEGHLGRGGMGVVWRATDQLLGRQVAVKELFVGEGDVLSEDEIGLRRERTLREARALAQLGHPHIIGVHDVVEAGDRPYIVMELVDGPSLAERIARNGPVGPREAARIGIALLDALGKAHASGILHRDLKPANVLLEAETGRVVLTDFGVAQVSGATTLTEAGSFLGSPEYTAPERVTGARTGPESDLWSLGALLCAAVSGVSPFRRNSLSAVLLAVVSDDIRFPAQAAPLLRVIRGLLERDPDRRLDAERAEEMLRAYVDTGRVPASPSGSSPSGRRGADRSRRASLSSRLPLPHRTARRGTSRPRPAEDPHTTGDPHTAEATRPDGDDGPDGDERPGGDERLGGKNRTGRDDRAGPDGRDNRPGGDGRPGGGGRSGAAGNAPGDEPGRGRTRQARASSGRTVAPRDRTAPPADQPSDHRHAAPDADTTGTGAVDHPPAAGAARAPRSGRAARPTADQTGTGPRRSPPTTKAPTKAPTKTSAKTPAKDPTQASTKGPEKGPPAGTTPRLPSAARAQRPPGSPGTRQVPGPARRAPAPPVPPRPRRPSGGERVPPAGAGAQPPAAGTAARGRAPRGKRRAARVLLIAAAVVIVLVVAAWFAALALG